MSQSSLIRKIITITAEESPNVVVAMEQKRLGIPLSHEIMVPGLLTYDEFVVRRKTWDIARQTIGLDAQFYRGQESYLYPESWLSKSKQVWESLKGQRRFAVAMGVDPAEGGDATTYCIVDDLGVIELIAKKTPDTTQVVSQTKHLIHTYSLNASKVYFDAGGGGKQHADRLRMEGYNVGVVGFGEAPTPPITKAMKTIRQRNEVREDKYIYRNRRAEMADMVRDLLNPSTNPKGFGICESLRELHNQLSVIPLTYDSEGRMYLLPKNRGRGESGKTLTELVGHSPDEYDSLMLAVFAMKSKTIKKEVGGFN